MDLRWEEDKGSTNQIRVKKVNDEESEVKSGWAKTKRDCVYALTFLANSL
mgnify:CR=1 FL=1